MLENTTSIICPHCGYRTEIHAIIYDMVDKEVEVGCMNCSKTFLVLREIEISYTTREKEE